MLENFLLLELDELLRDHDLEDTWFQEDGAKAHTSRHSMQILRQMFPGHLVSLRGHIGWAPRSPDLTPCFFFVGLPQGKSVHTSSPNYRSTEGCHHQRNQHYSTEYDSQCPGKLPKQAPSVFGKQRWPLGRYYF
jgi:hypothetical protein